ncbi:hypothetical protein DM01DRAFT_1337902, partial [Hesseltinella vesiculosa]
MSKQRNRRLSIRKEQSTKDKLKHIDDTSNFYYGKLAIHPLVISMQEHVKIPLEFIDMTAAFITTLLSGHDYLVSIHTSGSKKAVESFQSNVNFIRKTLSRAQISYHSLIVCLWYIDHWFHRHQHHSSAAKSWTVRELFLASIIVAEKYWVDCTWSSQGWSECTQYLYSCQEINALVQHFLMDLDYALYISEQDYVQFCHYLDFKIHVRQFMLIPASQMMLCFEGGTINLGMPPALSYHNLQVLSEPLTHNYAQRLRLSLPPLQALTLFTKIGLSFSLAYAAAIAATALMCQYATWLVTRVLWEQWVREQWLASVANRSPASLGLISM